jgi:hypothetical protein
MSENQFCTLHRFPIQALASAGGFAQLGRDQHLNRHAIGATLSAVFPNVAKPAAIVVA